jgi:hypothetical protein
LKRGSYERKQARDCETYIETKANLRVKHECERQHLSARECCEELFLTFSILFQEYVFQGRHIKQRRWVGVVLHVAGCTITFERMNVVLNEIRDRMDKQDAVIATCREGYPQRVPNARRQERHAHVDDFDDDHDDEFEDEDDRAFNGDGRFVPRGERRGRSFQRDPRWQNGTDRNLGNIKMKIRLSKGKTILKRIWNGRRRWS